MIEEIMDCYNAGDKSMAMSKKNEIEKMARYKHPHRKSKLIKANSRTSWAPVFAILKKFGSGKKVHPSRISQQRSWRRTKLKL